MKKITFITLLLLTLLLVACGGAEPTPVPPTDEPAVEAEPTAVPTEAAPTEAPPTEEVAPTEEAYIDTLEHTPDPELIDKTWAWERRDPNGNEVEAIVIDNPENYTLFFNEDGTFNAKVDCNSMNGRYATDATGSIFMEAGAMTMAMCPEGSQDLAMLEMFGPAQNYRFEEEGEVLVFSWAAGGPVDYYRHVPIVELPAPAEEAAATGTVTAPDGIFLRTGPGTNYPSVGAAPEGTTGEIIGVSVDGEWWLANAPNLPGGQVWGSAQWVEVSNAENVPVVAAPPLPPTLTGIPWEWVGTVTPVEEIVVNDPTRYVVLFNADGTVNIQADCNTVFSTYTTDGSSITINPGISTLMACPEDSQSDQFMTQLNAAAIYFIQGGNLYIDLFADAGTMRFVPQGTPPPSEDAPAGEADATTFYLVSFGPAGAETPVLEGTQITASFSQELISGNAGCNNYSAVLTPTDGFFTVGPIISTLMFCAEPEGVMDQEQAYLAALQGITSYQWEQQLVNEANLVTTAQLTYTLADGTAGVMNFTTSP
jgi:heat shock protein HslJ